MMPGARRLVRVAFLVLWIIPLAAHAGNEENVDIEEALGAVLPAAGLGGPPPEALGDAPMPRVCTRYALQIARSLKLAQRAAATGDVAARGRVQGQVAQIEARARCRCPQLD